MRLPLIKHIHKFIQDNDADYIHEAIEVLESLSDAKGITDQEMDVSGELMSNLFGALEVHKSVQQGTPEKEALNSFMQRVMGSIDS